MIKVVSKYITDDTILSLITLAQENCIDTYYYENMWGGREWNNRRLIYELVYLLNRNNVKLPHKIKGVKEVDVDRFIY